MIALLVYMLLAFLPPCNSADVPACGWVDNTPGSHAVYVRIGDTFLYA